MRAVIEQSPLHQRPSGLVPLPPATCRVLLDGRWREASRRGVTPDGLVHHAVGDRWSHQGVSVVEARWRAVVDRLGLALDLTLSDGSTATLTRTTWLDTVRDRVRWSGGSWPGDPPPPDVLGALAAAHRALRAPIIGIPSSPVVAPVPRRTAPPALDALVRRLADGVPRTPGEILAAAWSAGADVPPWGRRCRYGGVVEWWRNVEALAERPGDLDRWASDALSSDRSPVGWAVRTAASLGLVHPVVRGRVARATSLVRRRLPGVGLHGPWWCWRPVRELGRQAVVPLLEELEASTVGDRLDPTLAGGLLASLTTLRLPGLVGSIGSTGYLVKHLAREDAAWLGGAAARAAAWGRETGRLPRGGG